MEALLLVILVVLSAAFVEAASHKIVRVASEKADRFWGSRKFQFHLLTTIIISFVIGVLLMLSISVENGRPNYIGWPLPAKTPQRDQVYSINTGQFTLGPSRIHWNGINIVCNGIIAIVALFSTGLAAELLTAKGRKDEPATGVGGPNNQSSGDGN